MTYGPGLASLVKTIAADLFAAGGHFDGPGTGPFCFEGRAVTTMFLLGGDEDLREGVVAAQGLPPRTKGHSQGKTARLAGHAFAAGWVKLATRDEVQKLLHQAPVIPVQLDAQLLSSAEQTLGPLRERQDLKKDLRAGFWSALKAFARPL